MRNTNGDFNPVKAHALQQSIAVAIQKEQFGFATYINCSSSSWYTGTDWRNIVSTKGGVPPGYSIMVALINRTAISSVFFPVQQITIARKGKTPQCVFISSYSISRKTTPRRGVSFAGGVTTIPGALLICMLLNLTGVLRYCFSIAQYSFLLILM